MTKPRVLITGSNGFLGRHMVNQLLSEGAEVIGIGRTMTSAAATGNGYEYAVCDINNSQALRREIQRFLPQFVVHLAAESHVGQSWQNPVQYLVTNALATSHLLEALREAEIPDLKRVLLVGSAHEYMWPPLGGPLSEGDALKPASPYGWSKLLQSKIASMYALLFSMPVVIARAFPLIGPAASTSPSKGQSRGVCTELVRQVVEMELGLRSPILKIRDPRVQRDFLDVRDAVTAFKALLFTHPLMTGWVFNVCSGRPVALADIITVLESASSCPFQVVSHLDLTRQGNPDIVYGSNDKLRRLVSWKPNRTLSDSVLDTLHQLRTAYASENLGQRGMKSSESNDDSGNAS